MHGVVFNIQRFTIHDGPGLRTEIFLKGCPLKCDWCSNPESLKPDIEIGVYKTKCISLKKCGTCKDVCPQKDALIFYRGKLTSINRDICTKCLQCFNECPSDAIKQWGKFMTVSECMTEILKDKGYYDRSGGGVTVSGGEPLLQSDFVASLFEACRSENIQTCCESSLYTNVNNILKILPCTDIIISDIKHMDTDLHKKYTGVHNNIILENLIFLSKQNKQLILRIPVIPNINDDINNIKATADFILNELNGKINCLQLLSFMRLGEEKYLSLGMPYKMQDIKINRKSFQKQVAEIAAYFNSRGINCMIGTK